jgi:hypothetical protein
MKLKSRKERTAHFIFKNDDKRFKHKKRFYFFLCAMFQSAFIFFTADKTGLLNEIIFISSIAAAIIFTAFALIAGDTYKIIPTAIVLFSVLLVFDGITNFTMLLKGIIAIVLIYAGLINTFIEAKNARLQNGHS